MGIDRGQGTPVSSNPLELDNDDYSSTVVGPQGPKGDDGDITPEYTQMYNDTIAAKNTATSKASEASASASNASTSETNANTSANAASASATSASNSASASATSETNAATSESNAASSATSAASSATSASGSASTATTKASEAATSASTATTKASEAATSASTATTKASEAATSATNAASSESAASTSATNAATSATAAASSASNASTSETNAASSATSAATSATNAAASESSVATNASNAATSETNAANSATSASTSASTATTKASEAATSASTATTKASEASTSASNAATSATSAATSATNAAASFDSFDDRYLGSKSSEPTVDNDGDALLTGALYFNSTTNTMKVYSGSSWLDAYATLSGALLTTGGTMTGDLDFNDNVKAKFGASDDLQIYHDGSNSVIGDSGTGELSLQTNGTGVRIWDNANSQSMAVFNIGGASKLAHNGSWKLATTSTGVDVTGEITADGIALGDSQKATFGASDDLQIYHDGTNSWIRDTGSGSLIIRGQDFVRISGETSGYTLADFVGSTGESKLFHQSNLKLKTTSTGVDVTGTVNADGLTVDGTSILDSETNFVANSTASNKSLVLASSGATGGSGQYGASLAFSRINTDSPRAAIAAVNTDSSFERMGLSFWTHPHNSVSNMSKRMQIDHNGDISFYEDTGTTPKFYWDASAESLGIGTSSPQQKLHMHQANSGQMVLAMTNATTGSGSSDGLHLGIDNSEDAFVWNKESTNLKFATSNSERMRIDSSGRVGIGTSSPSEKLQVDGNIRLGPAHTTRIGTDGTNAYFENFANGAVIFRTNNYTERMRITSSGNVGIGTSSPTQKLEVANGYGIFEGIKVGQNGTDIDSTFLGANSLLAFKLNGSEKMRIDSSGKVGIGELAPEANLHVKNGSAGAFTASGASQLLLENNTTVRLTLISPTTNSTKIEFGDINDQDIGTIDYSHFDDSMRFGTNAAERMRIDSSGNVLFGTTSTDTVSNTGVVCKADGQLFVGAYQKQVATLTRQSNDGEILRFRKDGSTVGSIGTSAGDLYITSRNSTGLKLYAPSAGGVSSIIHPSNTSGSPLDNVMDLGYSSGRFKDAYFSGTVNANAFVGDGSGLTGISGGGGDDGPAFQAHTHATGTGPPQTLANNTWTKCNFGHEVVDTDNCFASSRFTPDVAGWYIINCSVLTSTTSTTWSNRIRKNSGTSISEAVHVSTVGNTAALQNSAIVYLNGSTDYVEVDNKQQSGSSVYGPQITFVTYFNGALVRKQ